MGAEVLVVLSIGLLLPVFVFFFAALQLYHQLDRAGKYLDVLAEAIEKVQKVRNEIMKKKYQPN